MSRLSKYSSTLCFLLACPALPGQSAAQKNLTCPIVVAPAGEAQHAYAAGQFAEAEKLFAAQVSGPAGEPGYAGLVTAQIAQDKLPESLAAAQAAAAAFPASGDAIALPGDSLARAGQIPEAFAAYKNALAIDPCSWRAHRGMAHLEELTGMHTLAAKELGIAHKLAPALPEVTAAWLDTLPAAQRAAPLRSFLAEHPALPPWMLQQLTEEAALLTQDKICRLTEESPSSVALNIEPIMLTGRRTRSWGLELTANDKKLGLAELDSSISGIVLNPADAAKAGARPLNGQPADPDALYTAVLDRLRIGNLEYHNCAVTVAPARALAGANSLIGTEFFRDHLIRIDYPAQRLTLSALPPLTGEVITTQDAKDWTPVYIAGPNILVPTLINKKGPFLFALDTGIVRSTLSPAVTAAELHASHDRTLNFQGSSSRIVKVLPLIGGVDVANYDVADVHGPDGTLLPVSTPVKLPVLRFASTETPDPYMAAFDITPKSHDAGVEIGGLLGFDLLQGYFIEINYRDAKAKLVFDQNRRYRVQQAEKTVF